jgi:hypothetical protein
MRAGWSGEDFVAGNLRRLRGAGLRWIQIPGDVKLVFEDSEIEMPVMVAEALALSPQAALKTLDLLHLAAVVYARRVLNIPLQRVVTLDKDFLRKKRELSNITGTTFETPSEVVVALGI